MSGKYHKQRRLKMGYIAFQETHISTAKESELVWKLFKSYIDTKVKDPKAPIKAGEIKEV